MITPSPTDLRTYRALLDDPDTGFGRLTAVIVVPHVRHGWEQPQPWAWTFTGSVLRTLPMIVDTGGTSA